jgi:hypothetical protein
MTASDAGTASTPRNLLVASTLSWLLGIIVLLSALAIGIPAATGATSGGWTFVLVAGAAGIGLCYAGYGLRKGLRTAGWTGILAAGSFVALQLVGTGGRPSLPMLLYAAIVVLVVTNWKSLK